VPEQRWHDSSQIAQTRKQRHISRNLSRWVGRDSVCASLQDHKQALEKQARTDQGGGKLSKCQNGTAIGWLRTSATSELESETLKPVFFTQGRTTHFALLRSFDRQLRFITDGSAVALTKRVAVHLDTPLATCSQPCRFLPKVVSQLLPRFRSVRRAARLVDLDRSGAGIRRSSAAASLVFPRSEALLS